MRRVLIAAVLLVSCLCPANGAQLAFRRQVWFAPGPGTPDLLRLFESLDEWPKARSTIDVFKFYQQHTLRNPTSIVGPNRLEAFEQLDAFRRLFQWGKLIAIEAGAVKEFYCTTDDTGMRRSVRDTVESIANVRAARGRVAYIAMDEPFAAGGNAAACGGPALAPTADRLVTYVNGVHAEFPDVRIGLIEPYPFVPAGRWVEIMQLLRERKIVPAFLHVDVNLADIRPDRDRLGRDLIQLENLAHSAGIPFGVIIWGADGDADSQFAAYALRLADEVHHTYRSWDVMPEHLIFQSWATTRTGAFIIPANLPETRANTLTAIMNDVYQTFRTVGIPRD
jgi:hypothetical protein